MVVGRGLLASAFLDVFSDRPDTIIFASGVSNSQERDGAAFMREKELLGRISQDDKRIVYFSTCSIYDPELQNTPYVIHKREMEAIVRQARYFAIFRLPQVVGKTSNTNTLTNFIHKKIVAGEHFDVWRYAKRNIIDIADVATIAKYILSEEFLTRQTTNIANPSYSSIIELVEIFELVLGRKAVYTVLDAGGSYNIDTELSTRAADRAGVVFNECYLEHVIRKYYG